MTEQELKSKKKQVMDEALKLAEQIKPEIKAIEAGPKLTQNHYGRYLTLLSRYENYNERMFYAVAFVLAGANKAGVQAALDYLGKSKITIS